MYCSDPGFKALVRGERMMKKSRGADARQLSEFEETQYIIKHLVRSTIPTAIAPTGLNCPTAYISAEGNHSASRSSRQHPDQVSHDTYRHVSDMAYESVVRTSTGEDVYREILTLPL